MKYTGTLVSLSPSRVTIGGFIGDHPGQSVSQKRRSSAPSEGKIRAT